MRLLREPLAPIALANYFLGVLCGVRLEENVPESLADDRSWGCMITASPRVNFLQELTVFLFGYAVLEDACDTALVQLPLDDCVHLGPANDAPGLVLLFWEVPVYQICEERLSPSWDHREGFFIGFSLSGLIFGSHGL